MARLAGLGAPDTLSPSGVPSRLADYKLSFILLENTVFLYVDGNG